MGAGSRSASMTKGANSGSPFCDSSTVPVKTSTYWYDWRAKYSDDAGTDYVFPGDDPANAEKALWLLVGDGGKARGEAGRHDDRVAHLVGPQGLETVKREAPLLNETGVLCVMQDGIHRTKGEARRHAELSLGHPSFRFRKRDKHLEHAFRERHGTSDTLEPVC